MPHPNSPRRPRAADPLGSLSAASFPKDSTSLPPRSHIPAPSSSSLLSTEVSYMAAATHERTYSSHHHSQSALMKNDNLEEMQWSTPSNISISHMGQKEPRYHITTLAISTPETSYPYTQNDNSYVDNYNLSYPTQYPVPNYTASYDGLELTSLPYTVSTPEAYPPAAYQIEPQICQDAMDLTDQKIDSQLNQLSSEYENYHCGPSHIKSEESCGYQSPYSDLTTVSTPHDDSPRYSTDTETVDEPLVDKDLPYAQLIYQALMAAPDKTMILRDIYDWFRKYTDKSLGSETKGWQNSIRHNLSMNGAFEKVIQQCEDSRKGFMWRLTEDAIRNGVKSTTRYRSKNPTKRIYRSQHLQLQRQASGAKGGQAARRSARLRRINGVNSAYRSEPFISRSIPSTFDPGFHSAGESSPCYGREQDYGYRSANSEYGSPLAAPSVDLFPPARSHMGTNMPHGLPITDTAFFMDQSQPESLFSNSPSPSASEPRTPEYQSGWDEDINFGGPYVMEDLNCCEYAG